MKIYTISIEAVVKHEGQIYAHSKQDAQRIAMVGLALAQPTEVIQTKIIKIEEYRK